jgi:predicted TIM-barrel fold metal-dependent hydrolase
LTTVPQTVAPKIIDVDTHMTEPHDLWISRAPPKWRDRVPQVRDVNGVPHWVLDGEILSTIKATSVIRPDRSKAEGYAALALTFHEVHPACHNVAERLRLMDELGISAQIIYPNLVGFGGGRIFRAEPALKTLCVQIYNDAMAEIMEASGQRLFGMGLLPWWDIEEATAEARRCKQIGLRGVNMNPEPHLQGLPDLGDERWSPLFEVCQDLNLPINFHIGASEDQIQWLGSRRWPSQTDDQMMAAGTAVVFLTNAGVISNIIISGITERFPRLKFVSVESGVGWIPFLLESLDYYVHDISTSVSKQLTMRPSDYFRRNFYSCFWFEGAGVAKVAELIGEDHVMFETDFPHPTCFYPNPVERALETLSDVRPALRDKLLAGNAARLYDIPI